MEDQSPGQDASLTTLTTLPLATTCHPRAHNHVSALLPAGRNRNLRFRIVTVERAICGMITGVVGPYVSTTVLLLHQVSSAHAAYKNALVVQRSS
jgi:hypothetical protein